MKLVSCLVCLTCSIASSTCLIPSRLLMRELMVFREQMFQHLHQEWVDVLRRASGLWTPRWRMVAAAAPRGGVTTGVGSGSRGSGVKDTERLLSQARNAELDVPARAAGSASSVHIGVGGAGTGNSRVAGGAHHAACDAGIAVRTVGVSLGHDRHRGAVAADVSGAALLPPP